MVKISFFFSELLTLYTLTSVWIFSLQLSKHFLWCWKENLLNNQELLQLVIISFILITLMFDSQVILWGEIWCWSQMRVKKLNVYHLFLIFYLHSSVTVFLRLWNTWNMSPWVVISWLIKALSGGHYCSHSAVRSFQL